MSISIDGKPGSMAASSSGDKIYALVEKSVAGYLAVINAKTGDVLDEIRLHFSAPKDIYLSEAQGVLFVTSSKSSRTIEKIGVSASGPEEIIEIPGDVGLGSIVGSRSAIYVLSGPHEIQPVKLPEDKLLPRFSVRDSARRLAISGNGNYLAVSVSGPLDPPSGNENGVEFFDLSSPDAPRYTPLAGQPNQIAMAPDGGRIYTTTRFDTMISGQLNEIRPPVVSVIETTNHTIMAEVPVDGVPGPLTVSPKNGNAYVLFARGRYPNLEFFVGAIDPLTNKIAFTIAVAQSTIKPCS